MKAFLSWSGESSKAVATALDGWLKYVFPEVTTWMSARDILAGDRWGTELDRELKATNFGVLCLVPSNLMAPWLLFEAGALSKVADSSRVVPYCVGFPPEDVRGPLSRFQGVDASEGGTYKLLQAINALLDNKRSESDLQIVFDKWWPDLKGHLDTILASSVRGPNQVIVQSVLFASTAQFEELGAEQDVAILKESYPGKVTEAHNVKLDDLRQALTSGQFQIVHLLGYVETKSGDFVFVDGEQIHASGLLKLLEHSQTQLLFLATCDSLTLGAILSRNMSVIAASDAVDAARMIQWERCFYDLLGEGNSLATSYDLAQATTELPMRLLIRNDTVFMAERSQ